MIETKSPEKVHYEISKMLSNGVSYIDALVEYAKQNNIEIYFMNQKKLYLIEIKKKIDNMVHLVIL